MKTYTYFVEGECEQKLLDAIKVAPSLIHPGKVRVFNVIKNCLKTSNLISIKDGYVVFVFDSDVPETGTLKQNIETVKRICPAKTAKLLFLVQVMNLEDELIRATDINNIEELTRSKSRKNFKSDFLTLKNCRSVLERHCFDIKKMWCKEIPEPFSFISQGTEKVVCA